MHDSPPPCVPLSRGIASAYFGSSFASTHFLVAPHSMNAVPSLASNGKFNIERSIHVGPVVVCLFGHRSIVLTSVAQKNRCNWKARPFRRVAGTVIITVGFHGIGDKWILRNNQFARKMPALQLFGRKWLAASDDLVYPGLFEIFIRVLWLVLVGISCLRFYDETWKCRTGGELVRVFLAGEMVILGVVTILVFVIVNHSARGSITDTHARRFVQPLLTIKILLLLPEIVWNILGTLWVLSDHVDCKNENYTLTVVEALVFFDWVLIGLAILGLALVFDPLGSLGLPDKVLEDSIEHGKVSRIWLRRFKFLWWMRRDESANDTFQHVAGLLSALFRGTDLVPSDVMAGCVLLRVRQKRETLELRRLNILKRPEYTIDSANIFAGAPNWMSLERAHHYLKLAIASYGWLYVVYQHACTGCFRLARGMTCCACFRRERTNVLDDNCCLCSMAGVKYLSKLPEENILFASFRNHLCEIPFCVIADHKTSSIVIAIRGSLSVRDLITDIAAASESFHPEGLPPDSMAHKGMIVGAKVLLKQLEQYKILENAFATYPHYSLVLTGHSLGAGLAVLLALLIRPRYPHLKVYAFSTPAGLLSREAARVTEEFVLTVGLGDDLVMRLSVDSIENFRTSLLITLQACRLPKYRVVLNGFGYILFGVPDRDLNRTWRNGNTINSIPGQLPLLSELPTTRQAETMVFERDVTRRRYSKVRLYNAGRILHLARCKPSQPDKSKKVSKKERQYEMRWAEAEDFMELSVMPRMLLDHLPENLEFALATLLRQQEELPVYIDSS
ncbi:diacylglycerol lipase-beta-like isoform X2 [Venturia canescens]|uniref:diacylglycerol lipase-beta-like isoform X2 n=1 Tax=Venturia canescens TaxID=32260 RepID=UPI001C9BCFD2|nr:diacylglycerol lipase-beta-like isoform X2 [Venturia canescens]